MSPLKVANCAGFWGDDILAAAQLLSKQEEIDFITLDYLAEVSLSIMAIQKEKDPSKGYASDFLEVIASLIPFWKKGLKFKVVTNGGGLNPRGLGEAILKLLEEKKCLKKVVIVEGDDVLSLIKSDEDNPLYNHLESKSSIKTVVEKLKTANAYLGAKGIKEALELGGEIVITGRTADPSLTVGPASYHFKWEDNEYNKLAGATIAGHLIECGTQVTGGISTDWIELENTSEIGFPIAEIFEDGSCIITKAKGTGGKVSELIVKEQLLYEISDPTRYLSPDCTVSFLGLTVKEVGVDRVLVKGALGSPPPLTLKVSATYTAGYKSDASLILFGDHLEEKGRKAAENLFESVKRKGFDLEKRGFELIGISAVSNGILKPLIEPLECVLRLSVADSRKSAVEAFTKSIASMVTAGPQGTTGYLTGRGSVRPRFGYWPCLIAKELVTVSVEELNLDVAYET